MREQWFAAGEATHVAILVFFTYGHLVSSKKRELGLATVLPYLGNKYDSDSISFRVPLDQLGRIHLLLQSGRGVVVVPHA